MKDDRAYLGHISEAIAKLEQYLAGIEWSVFINDPMRIDAVIRQLEIIGEAAHHLSKEFHAAHSEIPFEDMIGMRNMLIHGYVDVDLEVVWKTSHEDLPVLKKAITELLNQ